MRERERGKGGEKGDRREREKSVYISGFIYPQDSCNVPPCHRPINGASPRLSLSLFDASHTLYVQYCLAETRTYAFAMYARICECVCIYLIRHDMSRVYDDHVIVRCSKHEIYNDFTQSLAKLVCFPMNLHDY